MLTNRFFIHLIGCSVGPVGMQGLLTTKWILDGAGNCVTDFANGDIKYKHEPLPLVDFQ
jgi:hypothetical protein